MAEERASWAPFTEKAFYLAEFRDRTLAIACATDESSAAERMRPVLQELEQNRTRIVLLAGDREVGRALDATVVSVPPGRAIGSVWRALCSSPRVAVVVDPGDPFLAACRTWAVRLRVSKLVFVDALGAVLGGDGCRVSFVHLEELVGLLTAPFGDAGKRTPLLREVEAALRGGVPAVNVCTADELGEELFSYAGSGTLFTLGRYVDVRRLGIDDFDAANDLVARGVAEGYLAARSEEELDLVFANGFGAFVEARHLAGIGALIPHPESGTSEVASLYTLTRFLGEGVGGHLLEAFCRASHERGDVFLFACTTTERVAGLFERYGFRRVAAEDLPAEKWRGYDAERRARLICLRRDPETV